VAARVLREVDCDGLDGLQRRASFDGPTGGTPEPAALQSAAARRSITRRGAQLAGSSSSFSARNQRPIPAARSWNQMELGDGSPESTGVRPATLRRAGHLHGELTSWTLRLSSARQRCHTASTQTPKKRRRQERPKKKRRDQARARSRGQEGRRRRLPRARRRRSRSQTQRRRSQPRQATAGKAEALHEEKSPATKKSRAQRRTSRPGTPDEEEAQR